MYSVVGGWYGENFPAPVIHCSASSMGDRKYAYSVYPLNKATNKVDTEWEWMLWNAVIIFGVLWRVQKASFMCISTCRYHAKRSSTHRVMCSSSSSKNPQLLGNAWVVFGVLWHVQKASFTCISTYRYPIKRTSTHWVIPTPSSWYMERKPAIARERVSRFWRSLVRSIGLMYVYQRI